MIVFRADANETATTGHLMRCMTIAEACREKGVECEFWLAEDKETERLRQAGFSYRILGSQWDDLEKELPFLERQLDDLDRQGKKVTYLVADSYQATPRYLGKLNDRIPVLYIDDMRMQIYPVAKSVTIYSGQNKKFIEYRRTIRAKYASLFAWV